MSGITFPLELNRDGYQLLNGHTRYQVLRNLGYSDDEIREHFTEDNRDRPSDEQPPSPWPPSGTH